jgi:PPP family 3-phenylpropionic acid transporter
MSDAPAADLPVSRVRGEAAPPVIGALYFFYYCVLGGSVPFVALYLADRGLAPDRVAYVLAALPILGMLATPAWAFLADRLQSATLTLRISNAGALAAFAALEARDARFGAFVMIAALLVFSAFRASTPALLDTLALSWTRGSGGDYGRLRAWGTVGYTVAAFAMGALIESLGPASMVHANLVLLAVTVVVTLTLRGSAHRTRTPLLPAVALLARRPRFLFVIGTGALHELGLSAYEALYPTELTRLAGATYAGAAIAFGAASEVVFMTYARKIAGRWSPERMLALAYAGSCIRWILLATVREPHLLVLVQALNALTFGAFFLAAVVIVDQESPESVRASAQGLFGAFIWGLTRGLALMVAGTIWGRFGMPLVFAAAALSSGVATLIALHASRKFSAGRTLS